ncbi:MAG TPA: 50S ribosomal protein L21 [Candidatus Saccharimonas sp.]|nr:50S ribosomal protein L21 [Candidatus Saccharimonas sp.]
MKAVIKVGGKQYLVAEKQTLLIDKLGEDVKTLDLEPLMLVDGDASKVGAPVVKGAKVSVTVIEPVVKGDKLQVIRFKAKKRVKTISGHRQKHTQIQISKIAA